VSAAAQIALDVAALSPAEARQEATRRMSPMLEGLRKCLNDEGRDQDRRAAAIAEKGSLVGSGAGPGVLSGVPSGVEEVVMSAKQLERAVEAGDLVEAFKSFGVTQTDVAQVTRTDPKTVYAWRASNTRPRSATYDRLDGLREVVRTLADSLTPRGVGQWLHASNRLLGGRRPLEVLREGETDAVLQAARSFVDGAYV